MNSKERKQKQTRLHTLIKDKSGTVLSEIGEFGGALVSAAVGLISFAEKPNVKDVIIPAVLTVAFATFGLITERIRRADKKEVTKLQSELASPH